jgi:hypothetical protein
MSNNTDIDELRDRVEQLEEQQAELKQGAVDAQGRAWSVSDFLNMGLTRRQALQSIGVLAGGATLGTAIQQAVGVASADPSTTDGDGDVGTPDNRVDVFADEVSAASLDSGLPFRYTHTEIVDVVENAVTDGSDTISFAEPVNEIIIKGSTREDLYVDFSGGSGTYSWDGINISSASQSGAGLLIPTGLASRQPQSTARIKTWSSQTTDRPTYHCFGGTGGNPSSPAMVIGALDEQVGGSVQSVELNQPGSTSEFEYTAYGLSLTGGSK